MEEKNEIKNEIIIEEKKDNQILKVLFFGKKGVGKTSIKSIIFDNMEPQETFNLVSTKEIQESHIVFINNIFLDILDCSSNESEVKQYLSTKKESIFSNVGVFIYIIEAKEEKDDDLKVFDE